MREYWMYFPFFVLRAWGKRSAEARSPHCAVLPIYNWMALLRQIRSSPARLANYNMCLSG